MEFYEPIKTVERRNEHEGENFCDSFCTNHARVNYEYNLKNKFYLPFVKSDSVFLLDRDFYRRTIDIFEEKLSKGNNRPKIIANYLDYIIYSIHKRVLISSIIVTTKGSSFYYMHFNMEVVDTKEEVYSRYRELKKLELPGDIVNYIGEFLFFV